MLSQRVNKWGNSLAVRIPRAFAELLAVNEGSEVELEVRDGALIITPRAPKRYELAALLEEIREENIHALVSTGGAVGGEEW